MRFFLAGSLLLLLIGSPGIAADTAPKSALDKATLETYVRRLFVWGPQIQVEVFDPEPAEIKGFLEVRVRASAGDAYRDQTFYVSEDGRTVIRASVNGQRTTFHIGENPFQADIDLLDTAYQPSLGTPGAPVKLVLFTDFQCAFCRQEAESLRKNLLQTYPEQVRLYFVDFPLESIHPWAKAAAIAGRCVFAQSEEAFWQYHDWVFAHQGEITPETLNAKVAAFAATLDGVDALQLNRCLDEKLTEPEVDRSLEMARVLELNATPTLFINGRKISQQLPWENLKQLIDFELQYQTEEKNAGDVDCCSVKLPTPAGGN